MLIIRHICETLWNFHNHLSLVTELLTSLPMITWLVNSEDNPGGIILRLRSNWLLGSLLYPFPQSLSHSFLGGTPDKQPFVERESVLDSLIITSNWKISIDTLKERFQVARGNYICSPALFLIFSEWAIVPVPVTHGPCRSHLAYLVCSAAMHGNTNRGPSR